MCEPAKDDLQLQIRKSGKQNVQEDKLICVLKLGLYDQYLVPDKLVSVVGRADIFNDEFIRELYHKEIAPAGSLFCISMTDYRRLESTYFRVRDTWSPSDWSIFCGWFVQ